MSKRDRAEPPWDLTAVDLRGRLEGLSESELHALPFGVIRLDGDGKVTFYSRTEGEQSGFGARPALGRLFFTEIAPCMGSPEFLARLEHARRAGALDITFEQVGDFDDAERELLVRVMSAADGGLWLCLQRQL
ncbi:MAG TPA: PAS domain-containing protein [Polyangiales bacterium]|nr:PAS domain-containing protein [Polyangiales bacterium]